MAFQKFTSIVDATTGATIIGLLDLGTSQTYAGNPNTHLAAQYVGTSCWDSSNSKLYIATAADGTVGGTTWTEFTSGTTLTQPVTVDDETGTVSGSRQLVDGVGTTINTATSGKIKVNLSSSTPISAVCSFRRKTGFWPRQLDSSTLNFDGDGTIWSIPVDGYGYSAGATTPLNNTFMVFFGTTTNRRISMTTPFCEANMQPRFHIVAGPNNNTTAVNCIYALYLAPSSGDNDLIVTTAPLNSVAGFRYNTTAGDTAWQCYSSDGTTGSVVSSGVSMLNGDGQMRIFEMDMSNYPTDIKYYIDGNLVATKTNNLPLAATKLGFYAGMKSTDSRTIYFEVSSALVESN